MKNKLKFEVGKTYFDNKRNDNFIVKRIDEENDEIDIKYENGTHDLCHYKGIVLHYLNFLESQLNSGRITLVEHKKISE